MSHDHSHAHDHGGTYYLDQLCTIAACGGLGGVAVMMYLDGRLRFILTPFFFVPVMVGGVALVLMAAVRAVTLWREAGAAAEHQHDHDHDHVHEHDHSHDHAHDHSHDHTHDHSHDHGQDHGHDHGWTPARYAVLMLPIVLFFLNLPNSTFSSSAIAGGLSTEATETRKVVDQHTRVTLGFQELANAAGYAKMREAFEGKTGVLTGKYSPINDREFTLFRVKMTCCAADAVPVQVRIVSDEPLPPLTSGKPVEVEGLIEFQKVVGRDKYLPVLHMKSAGQLKVIASVPDYGME